MEVAWYIPTHIQQWRECAGVGVNRITELIALNHPEAIAEEEAVDYNIFGELFTEAEHPHRGQDIDIIANICSTNSELQSNANSADDDLIDKFLELKDLRIVVDDEAESANESRWEQLIQSDSHSFEDDASSEELAAIYLSQGLFQEAKEIYTRLFLLYSEKSVYFAGLIEKIDKENN